MKTYLFIMILFAIGFAGVHVCFRDTVRRRFGPDLFAIVAVIMAVGVFTFGGAIFLAAIATAMLITPGNASVVGCRFLALLVLIPSVVQPVTIGGVFLLELNAVETLSAAALVILMFRPGLPGALHRVTAEDGFVLVLFLILAVAADRIGSPTAHLRLLLDQFLAIGAPYLVLRRAGSSRAAIQPLIETMAALAIIIAVIAVYEGLRHWAIFDIIWSNQSMGTFLSGNLRLRSGLMRVATTFFEPISSGVFEMVGLFAILAARRSFRSDATWLGALTLCAAGLLAAQSRGALVALLAGFVTIQLARRKYGRAVGMLALALALVGSVLAAAQVNSRISEFVGVTSHAAGEDVDYRQTLLRRGLEEGMHHWEIGADITVVYSNLVDITQGEHIVDFVNSYLYFFLISGALGMVPLIITLIACFSKSFPRGRRESLDKSFQMAQTFVYGALPGILVALLFTSFFERNPIWLLLGLVGNRALHVAPDLGDKTSTNVAGMPSGSSVAAPRLPVRLANEREMPAISA